MIAWFKKLFFGDKHKDEPGITVKSPSSKRVVVREISVVTRDGISDTLYDSPITLDPGEELVIDVTHGDSWKLNLFVEEVE